MGMSDPVPGNDPNAAYDAVVQKLGPVLWRAGDIVAGILMIGGPAAIFILLLSFALVASIAETIDMAQVCVVMAGLSWAAGWAMRYILTAARNGTLFLNDD
jgi:hypothetical protein